LSTSEEISCPPARNSSCPLTIHEAGRRRGNADAVEQERERDVLLRLAVAVPADLASPQDRGRRSCDGSEELRRLSLLASARPTVELLFVANGSPGDSDEDEGDAGED
jgi:hypothetical protein